MSWPTILTGGQVTVNQTPMTEVDMICPAWGTHERGFTQLVLGPKMVGDPIRTPGEYDRGQRRQPVSTERQFPLFMEAGTDRDGNPTNVWDNWDFLNENVFEQPDEADRPDGTRYVHLILPNGREGWADCTFLEPTLEPMPEGWFLVVQFEILQGHFLPLVS